MTNDRRQYCTLRVGDLFLGIDVESIQEVLHNTSITPVPLAHAAISGLINLRGQIVTAIDLRRRLELPERPATERPMNVVLPSAAGVVSLLVDRVGEVFEVDDSSFESPPETLRGAAREMIRGAYKLPDALLLVLNVDRVLNLGEEVGR